MNYVEFIENMGFRLTGDVGRQVELASPSTLIDFRERYLDLQTALDVQMDNRLANELSRNGESQVGRVFDCPDAEPHEFRPMFHGRLMESPGILGGDSGSAFETLDIDKRLRRIKTLLLYAHALVVPDSLFYVNQWFSAEGPYFEEGRHRLKNYLTVIAALRPLIEAGIVIMYPQYEHSGVGFSVRDGRGGAFDDSAFEEWLCERDQESLIAVSHSYNELLFFATRYDASVITPQGHGYDLILAPIAEFNHRTLRGDQRRDSRLGSALASIECANVDGLSLHDVIAIRRDSAAFETWRGLLSGAMKQIDNYNEAPSSAIVADVCDIVSEGKAIIDKEVRKSTIWDQARGPAGSCILSSLAGVLAKGALDWKTAGATFALSFLYQYVSGGNKRRAMKALRNHFATLNLSSE
jgi:hypothetical protein